MKQHVKGNHWYRMFKKCALSLINISNTICYRLICQFLETRNWSICKLRRYRQIKFMVLFHLTF